MNTNFFRQLAELDITGTLQLIIAKGEEGNYIVSTILDNEQCGDKAKNLIPPFNLRATPEELDREYFDRITTPIQTVSGVMVEMEAFLKQVEQAKAQSAMVKGKAEKERKETDVKDKKYKDAMAKVDELDKAGKPKDAWMKLPNPSEFPEWAEVIRKRRSELSAQFQPDLFGAIATDEQIPKEPTTLTDDELHSEWQNEEIEDNLDFDEDAEDEY